MLKKTILDKNCGLTKFEDQDEKFINLEITFILKINYYYEF